MLDDVQLHLVDSIDVAFDLLRWLSTRDRIAVDTESTGLSPERDRVRLVQFGDHDTAYIVPFERWAGVVDDVVARYDGEYVAHNASFDLTMLRGGEVDLPTDRLHDTRLMAHVLESTGSTALKTLAKRFVDPRAAALQAQLDDALSGRGGWTWATVPVSYQPYWAYAGLDTILTFRLDEELYPRVLADAPRSYELELAVSWVTERMERTGVRVDRAYTAELADQLAEYVERVETWCRAEYRLSPGSTRDVVAALQRDGVELTKRTNGGQLSLDKEVLASLAHPLAQAVLGRRQAQKLLSTYLMTYLKLTADGNDRIHPSINSIGGTGKSPFEPGGSSGVRTGRMSMSNPNLQNVPTRTKEGKRVRNCLVPADGNRWVKCDADQIEMRVMAHLSGDGRMLEAFTSPGDFFVNLARELFDDPDFQKIDPRRQLMKNGCYAKVYGAGISKFATTAGVSEAEATRFMRRFDELFPGPATWSRSVQDAARRGLDVDGVASARSPLTNRRHVADAGKLYTLVNYLVQGTAGELLKLKLVELDQAGLGEYLTLAVHDEVDLDVPADRVDDVIETLLDVVNDDQLLDVPVTWSADVGDRWGDCG